LIVVMRNYAFLFFASVLFLTALYLIHSKVFFICFIIFMLFHLFYISLLSSKETYEPKKIKSAVKAIIYAIPAVVVLYVLCMNIAPFLFDMHSTFSLDVGSENENSEKMIKPLSPEDRISDRINNQYRELKNSLVYSTIKIPFYAEKITITARFKDNFPENSAGFYIGAKDMEEWHYQYKPIYISNFEEFEELPKIQDDSRTLYFLNSVAEKFASIDEFIKNIPKNAIVATNIELDNKAAKINDYSPESLKITTSLRESHTFYVYAKENIILSVSKQDINWYKNEDNLSIEIYDSNNTLIANALIPDDGIINNTKEQNPVQKITLFTPKLTEGIYRIKFIGNADTIIREIEINQNKFVADSRVFLADNEEYGIPTIPSKLYTKPEKNSVFSFSTYHRNGFQTININDKSLEINSVIAKFNISTDTNDFVEISSEKNDIIVNSLNYFSFTKDSYFEPFEYRTTGINNAKNADYLLVDYKKPVEDNGWLIGTAEFNIDDLYIKNKELSIILNARHLTNQPNYTIPVDYLDITIHSKK